MEFNYNLNDIFSSHISRINHSLLPIDFKGDKRNAINSAAQVADIINTMGYASAKAQSLSHPITSADKMRDGEHILYLMIDPDDNSGEGSVVGLLKTGIKNLFLYDNEGKVHEKECLCVLDFYVHESKQRTGYGKKLYDYMLNDKGIEPNKLAFDKPSENLLSFLFKHYGLSKIYPQNNNFVMFEGFFDPEIDVNLSLESLDKSNQTEYQTTSSDYGDLHQDHNFSEDNFVDKSNQMKHQTDCTSSGYGHFHKDHHSSEDNFVDKSNQSEYQKECTASGYGHLHKDHHSSEDNFVKSDVYKPTLFGRHTAFKAQDSMGEYLDDHSPKQVESSVQYLDGHSPKQVESSVQYLDGHSPKQVESSVQYLDGHSPKQEERHHPNMNDHTALW